MFQQIITLDFLCKEKILEGNDAQWMQDKIKLDIISYLAGQLSIPEITLFL